VVESEPAAGFSRQPLKKQPAMTKEEFFRYAFDGDQWTKATIEAARMAQLGMIPNCDRETFEREVIKPDGFIPFRLDRSA
jgi:hypothetical protein